MDNHNSYYLNVTLGELAKGNLWWVDSIALRNNRLYVDGWAIAPNGKHGDVSFMVNGIQFEEVRYPICKPGFAKLYYFIPNSAMSGFSCVLSEENTARLLQDKVIAVSIVDTLTLVQVDGYHSVNFRNDFICKDSLPVPDDANLLRIGAQSIDHYRNVGFDKFIRLENALLKYSSKSFGDMRRVLDWGCGCGQVLRYFEAYKNVDVHGADIDTVNIQWCENNLSFAKFHHVPLNPPTQFADKDFDLIFGISVLTHLREADQNVWLSELSRITNNDGIVLLSVHGNGGVAFRNELFDFDKLLEWQVEGFIALGVDPVIDSISDKEFYTTSFQTDWYINENWSKYFDVIAVMPSYIGHFQDLVVLRKRK